MLRTLIIAGTIVCCLGCGPMANIPATYIAGQCYTGMPVQDFMALAGKKALIVRMENGWNVYKILEVVPGLGGFQDRSKFFYFANGKLHSIDEGVFRPERIQIEIIE